MSWESMNLVQVGSFDTDETDLPGIAKSGGGFFHRLSFPQPYQRRQGINRLLPAEVQIGAYGRQRQKVEIRARKIR